MRADRLVSLVLLLQSRGRMPAAALAAELRVSVRTVYRDLATLSLSGVPVRTESGPNGGCSLLEGYLFPLRGLTPSEASALLLPGVPAALAELGLADALAAAQRKIGVTSGRNGPALVHLDMPRWFGAKEDVPHLRTLTSALREQRQVALGYRHGDARALHPLGLVNKAGIWYLVACGDGAVPVVYRAGRITSVRVLAGPAVRPDGFDLAGFWAQWSVSFMASRPSIEVRLRVSPAARAVLPEIFGDKTREVLDAAGAPDEQGWREVTLTFEHEAAAAQRLAGFGGEVEVLSPATVRDGLIARAHAILDRYGQPGDSGALAPLPVRVKGP